MITISIIYCNGLYDKDPFGFIIKQVYSRKKIIDFLYNKNTNIICIVNRLLNPVQQNKWSPE